MQRRPYTNKSKNDDRFIPRRRKNNEIDPTKIDSNETFQLRIENYGRFDNLGLKHYNKNNYTKLLKEIFIPNSNERILSFSIKSFNSDKNTPLEPSWPVRNPRNKPIIQFPKSILDMPNMYYDIESNRIDWSKENCAATIYDGEIHMWYPKSDNTDDGDDGGNRRVTNTSKRVRKFLKWNKSGTLLAFGYHTRFLKILIKKTLKFSRTYACCRYGEIICCEWLNDYSLLAGCSLGCVIKLNLKTHCFTNTKLHLRSILKISVSCSGKYAATSGSDGKIRIWEMPDFKKITEFKLSVVASNVLTWHPWNDTIFAFCDNKIRLWNANLNKEYLTFAEDIGKSFKFDAISFNPISGEMVVSLASKTRDYEEDANIIMVLSNEKHFTEIFHYHVDRVPYILWGDNGRSLGTVGCDDVFLILDFFGPPPEKPKKPAGTPAFLLRNSIR